MGHTMRIRRWSVIIVVTAFAVLGVVDVAHEFIANDTIGYFSAEPQRLLYVAAIAIAGGLAGFGFYRLTPRAQWHVKVFGWGAAASIMTAVVGYAVFEFISLFSFIVESGGAIRILEVLLCVVLFSGITACLWYKFRHVWKTKVSR